MGSTRTEPSARAARAGSKGPQREPSRVISSTTKGARSRLAGRSAVVFKTSVPRGRRGRGLPQSVNRRLKAKIGAINPEQGRVGGDPYDRFIPA